MATRLNLWPRPRTSKNQSSLLFPNGPYDTQSTLQAPPEQSPFAAPKDWTTGTPWEFMSASNYQPPTPAGVPGFGSPRPELARFMGYAGGGNLGGPLTQAAPSPTSNAAQLLSGALAGNPFIAPEGLARLYSGRAPLLSEIDPTFWGATSPTMREALMGLYQSMGLRPADVEFSMRQWTPPSLY